MSTLLDFVPSIPISPKPSPITLQRGQMVGCAKACISAELAAGAWAASVSREAHPERLRSSLSLALDCMDICSTTGRLLTRILDSDREVLIAQLEACARATATCAAECLRHAETSPLAQSCADACHVCERECDGATQKLQAEQPQQLTAAAVRNTWNLP
jgi:hypothetical protein